MNLEKPIRRDGAGRYTENNHLSYLYTGNKTEDGWKSKAQKTDFYFIKAVLKKLQR